MATSREVYNRIRWDPRLDPRRFVIGYVDHAADRPLEAPLATWDGSVPWHRVRYFALDGRVVWSREGVDLLGSLEALGAPPDHADDGWVALAVHRCVTGAWVVASVEVDEPWTAPARCVTWNVLSERHDPAPERADHRRTLALAALRAQDADVIALQEVTRPFLARLLAEPWVQAAYAVTDAPGETLRPEGPLLLARRSFVARARLFPNGKRALVARFAARPRPLVVAAIHLTSDQARDAARKRATELAAVSAHLQAQRDEADVLLLGDLNARDADPGGLLRAGFRDAWRELHPADPGWTFVPSRNALAARTSWRGLPARFDRALLLARDLAPAAAARFGAGDEVASDHEGLRVELEPPRALDEAEPDVHTALAVLPPEATWPAFDALRRDHDPAFGRWPPHLNVLYPFVRPEQVEAALPVVAQALARLAPRPVSLSRFDVFEHIAGATVVVRPAGDLSDLHAALAPRFPRLPRREEWAPHLTLARCGGRAEAVALAERFARGWRPPGFDVRELALLVRGDDAPFAVRARLPLGGALEPWLQRAGARAPARDALVQRVRDALPGAALHVAGSTRLGVADADSDLDLVAVAPGAPLEAVAEALGRALGVPVRAVTDARVPVIRFALDGLPVDLQVVAAPHPDLPRLDALRAAALVRVGAPCFEAVALAVRTWARGRRILGQAWGFPGGLAWTRLAVDGLLGAPADLSPERLVARALVHAHERWRDLSAELSVTTAMTPATREVVEDELARAAALVPRLVEGAASWDELVLPPDPLHERGHALVLAADAPDAAGRERARGVLEREALRLVLGLERADGVRAVRPYPPRRDEPGVVGLHLADRAGVDDLTGDLAATLARDVPGARLRVWLDAR